MKDELIAKQKELIQALTEYSTLVVIMWNKDIDDDESKELKLKLWHKVKELREEISALETAIEQEPVTELVKVPSDIYDKINCLIGYLESWENSKIPVIAPFELKDVIIEANEWMKSQVKTIDMNADDIKILREYTVKVKE